MSPRSAWRLIGWISLTAACTQAGAQAGSPEGPPAPPQQAPIGAPAPAPAAVPQRTMSLADLEAAGFVIGEIRIRSLDIFDLQDPREDKVLFRWANAVHIQTREGVIRRQLLFKPGDPVRQRVFEETERLLRANRYLYDVQFHPLPGASAGVVDIEVVTRDTWSLDPGLSAGRTGGTNSSALRINEYNLAGTGTLIGLGHSRSVDRSSNEVHLGNDMIFGTRAGLDLSYADTSDGKREAASLVRPFYELDARWAAGLSTIRDDRLEAVYRAGVIESQYRHRQDKAEVFGGWSAGLVDGWVRRWSLGVSLLDDRFSPEPGLLAPAVLPADARWVSPFVRLDVVEDRTEREFNRNLIGRPEFFAFGLNSTVKLGRALPALGSTRAAWVYEAALSRGFEPTTGVALMATSALSGWAWGGSAHRQRLGVQAQLYVPQSPQWLFYTSLAGDRLTHGEPGDELMLGGDNGLRGYPLRYQSGTRRALLTVEERFYTDIYLWRLLRLGAAAFLDLGRAWGGADAAAADPRWLGNIGCGLRIVSARSAFGNVLHVDLAFPLNAPADIKRVQLLVKSRTSF